MPLLEELIETKTLEIKRAMSALGRRLEAGDESQLLVWVIPGNLACAHRPLDIILFTAAAAPTWRRRLVI
jgi:hypothetical protein